MMRALAAFVEKLAAVTTYRQNNVAPAEQVPFGTTVTAVACVG